MKLRGMNYKVIDDYFPEWIVDQVSQFFEGFPVSYSNSSKLSYAEGSRFFGNMIMAGDEWTIPQHLQSWFIPYLTGSLINDILKGKATNVHRVLVNGQVKGLDGVQHKDDEVKGDGGMISVIYHAHGSSGDTVVGVDRIPFKEGRMVIFDSYEDHRGEAPTEGYRVSLGMMFSYVWKNDVTVDKETQTLDTND